MDETIGEWRHTRAAVLILSALAGLFFSAVAIFDGPHDDELRENGVVVPAVVTDITNQGRWGKNVYVSFVTVDGKPTAARLDGSLYEELPRAGDAVVVRYAPSNPSGAIERGDEPSRVWSSSTSAWLATGLLGVPALYVGHRIYRGYNPKRVRSRRRLRRR